MSKPIRVNEILIHFILLFLYFSKMLESFDWRIFFIPFSDNGILQVVFQKFYINISIAIGGPK